MTFAYDFVCDQPVLRRAETPLASLAAEKARRQPKRERPADDDSDETSDVVWTLAYWSWL
ncbi:hypothetical protein OSH11_07915 [Kaistia dalseonensis]|uniref:Uncharacterized protein n=1 Tax=Kaistia dalseonensis TaxID=410840 RepID=A0ABU0H6R4_9HYPH|nr:hypothetical protein [Kaistia dalseonensis]MCX5494624.1 hypothetical protein [Kaistia dalseonensis]MDQ0437204.1 hypothetical protein [Kaistia dalseonensis]